MVVLDIAMYTMIFKKNLCASAARTASRQVVMRFQQHKEHDHPEQIFLQGARLRAGTTSTTSGTNHGNAGDHIPSGYD